VLGNVFGALVGAIVADVTGRFQAYDAADVANGILATSVFRIGSNFTFTAQQAGKIYLGVADAGFSDNGRPGFRATLSSVLPNAVPEPTPSSGQTDAAGACKRPNSDIRCLELTALKLPVGPAPRPPKVAPQRRALICRQNSGQLTRLETVRARHFGSLACKPSTGAFRVPRGRKKGV
jgi:hypothetical protein